MDKMACCIILCYISNAESSTLHYAVKNAAHEKIKSQPSDANDMFVANIANTCHQRQSQHPHRL